MLYKFTTKPW